VINLDLKDFNMNVGDNVLCKRTLITSSHWKEVLNDAFTEGEVYTIEDYELAVDEDCAPIGDNSYDISIYSILDSISYSFNTNPNNNDEHWVFSDYFYTKKEIRKKKLDKILVH